MAHAIGIDVGTTNVKKVLVDEAGRLVASASRGVSTLRSPNSVGQDAHALWDVVKTTITQLVSAAPEAADVVALGCCSQYSSIVPVDSRGVPVADMVLWQDTHGTEYALTALEQEGAAETWLERHGIVPVGVGLSLGYFCSLLARRWCSIGCGRRCCWRWSSGWPGASAATRGADADAGCYWTKPRSAEDRKSVV